jgi:hypothetical protein
MANDAVKSNSILNLDTVPIIANNAGAGAPGRTVTVDDYCAATAAGLQSSGSYYRLLRLETRALLESLIVATDSGPNLAGALALDLSLIFSDSTDDGTPAFLQNQIPQSTNTGATTTLAAYSSPNKIFGTWKPAAASTAVSLTDLIFNGLGANYSFTGGFLTYPLYQLFGFTDGRGQPSDPGGYFDLLAYVATGATTGGAANIYAKARYNI